MFLLSWKYLYKDCYKLLRGNRRYKGKQVTLNDNIEK